MYSGFGYETPYLKTLVTKLKILKLKKLLENNNLIYVGQRAIGLIIGFIARHISGILVLFFFVRIKEMDIKDKREM
jgi:Sec-independent protein secretion pathway component TatC